METVIALAEQVAPSVAASILITGRSGTGKEVLTPSSTANRPAPNRSSRSTARRSRKTWDRNSSATKGSFAGAGRAPRRPKFEGSGRRHAALDEIQRDGHCGSRPKLLRALRTRDRPGRRRQAGQVNIRVIAALQPRPRRAAVKTGTFRKTFSTASNVVNLRLPAARNTRPTSSPRPPLLQSTAPRTDVPDHTFDATARCLLLIIYPGAAMCASWRTPSTAPCCSPADGRSPTTRSRMPDNSRVDRRSPSQAIPPPRAPRRPPSVSRSFVGHTVSDMERDLILERSRTASATGPMRRTFSASRSARCATS